MCGIRFKRMRCPYPAPMLQRTACLFEDGGGAVPLAIFTLRRITIPFKDPVEVQLGKWKLTRSFEKSTVRRNGAQDVFPGLDCR